MSEIRVVNKQFCPMKEVQSTLRPRLGACQGWDSFTLAYQTMFRNWRFWTWQCVLHLSVADEVKCTKDREGPKSQHEILNSILNSSNLFLIGTLYLEMVSHMDRSWSIMGNSSLAPGDSVKCNLGKLIMSSKERGNYCIGVYVPLMH